MAQHYSEEINKDNIEFAKATRKSFARAIEVNEQSEKAVNVAYGKIVIMTTNQENEKQVRFVKSYKNSTEYQEVCKTWDAMQSEFNKSDFEAGELLRPAYEAARLAYRKVAKIVLYD